MDSENDTSDSRMHVSATPSREESFPPPAHVADLHDPGHTPATTLAHASDASYPSRVYAAQGTPASSPIDELNSNGVHPVHGTPGSCPIESRNLNSESNSQNVSSNVRDDNSRHISSSSQAHRSGISPAIQNSAGKSSGKYFWVDGDGFQRAYNKSQIRNWRKKLGKDAKRLQPIPYGLRSRARNGGQ